jgi:ABC-type transport system substrate-binding protein
VRRLGGLLALSLIAAACSSPATTSDAPATTVTTSTPATTTTAAADTTRPVRPASTTTTTTEVPTAPTGGRVAVPVYLPGDALFSFSPWSPGFVNAIGEVHLAGAVELDPAALDFVPNLVSEVPTTTNGGVVVRDDGTMTVTYRIRPEAVWEDGTPVSGEDFAFTYETIVGLALDDADLALYQEILPESVAVGEQTFSYTLPRATIDYERLFGVVLPRHAVAGTDPATDWAVRPWPSAGPFRFQAWAESAFAPGTPGSIAVFVRNESYWRRDTAGQALPYLDSVEFHFVAGSREAVEGFARKQVDIADLGAWPDVISRLASLAGVTVTLGDGIAWEHLAFQFGANDRNHTALNESVSFRRAVAHALDRRALAAVGSWVNGGALSSFLDLSPIPRGDGWDRYSYDPALAAALLEDACADLGRDCALQPPLVIINTTSGEGLRTEAGRLAEQMLDAVGLDARLAVEPVDVFFGPTFLRGTWDLGMWAWEVPGGLSGILRTLTYWDPAGPPPIGVNYQRWGTPAVSGHGADFDQAASSVSDADTARYAAILEEMRVTVDRDRLATLAAEAEEILADQVVIIPLATRGKGVAWWSGKVGGVRLHPSRPATWNIERWYRLDG